MSFWSNLEAKNGGWFLDSCCGENKTVKGVTKKCCRIQGGYILAHKLTLFKTGGPDYAHHYTTCLPLDSLILLRPCIPTNPLQLGCRKMTGARGALCTVGQNNQECKETSESNVCVSHVVKLDLRFL